MEGRKEGRKDGCLWNNHMHSLMFAEIGWQSFLTSQKRLFASCGHGGKSLCLSIDYDHDHDHDVTPGSVCVGVLPRFQ